VGSDNRWIQVLRFKSFKFRHVKNGVKALEAWGEFDAICDRTCSMSSGVRSDPALLELCGQCPDLDVRSGDHDEVTGFELQVTTVPVGVSLLPLLRCFHAGLSRLEVHVPVSDKVLY
jgi:hypothetical protein